MTPSLTAAPDLEAADRAARSAGLRLLRSSPRGEDRLLVTVDVDGDEVAGQWFADAERCAHVADRTRRRGSPTPVSVHGGRLLLQPGGADRRLPALADLVDEGAALVAHRPERRGVVRTVTGDYVKVVDPTRVDALAGTLREAAAWRGVRVPQVRAADPQRGTVTLEALPGATVHRLLADAGTSGSALRVLCDRARAAGRAVARLHRVPVPQTAAGHDLGAEIAVTERWVAQAASRCGLRVDRSGLLGGIRARAAAHRPEPGALLHRDLHDKQLLVDGEEVGILDLDLTAVGEPALDLANLLVHLELRGHQGLVPLSWVRPLAEALVDGYAPGAATRAGLALHASLCRLRLAAVYAFRPGDATGVVSLVRDPVLADLS